MDQVERGVFFRSGGPPYGGDRLSADRLADRREPLFPLGGCTLPGHIPHGNRGRPVTPPALTLSELDAAVGRYIVDTYHHRVHPETGQTPLARWSAGDWLPRMPDSLEALDLLLLTVATPRKVQRDGIHCHGLRYFSITLAPYVGEPVTIRYDPRDLAEIRVYHRDKFLCRAVSPDIASVTVSLQDLQTARNQRRRELRQQLTARRSLVELLTQPRPGSGRGEYDPEEEHDHRGLRDPSSHPAEAVPRRLTPHRPVGAQSWPRSSNWTPGHPAHRGAWSTSRSPGSTAGSSSSPTQSVRHRYIGVCYGAPGLGKTLSARTYAAADDYDYWFANRYRRDSAMPTTLVNSRTLMYTPELTITARRLNLEVGLHVDRLSHDIERALNPGYDPEFDEESECRTELVIIDEADRLKTTGLEQLRDFFDRGDLGLILIGMPGFDRQLARYPQLYSRIGFAHHYQPLDPDDIPTVLAQYGNKWVRTIDRGRRQPAGAPRRTHRAPGRRRRRRCRRGRGPRSSATPQGVVSADRRQCGFAQLTVLNLPGESAQFPGRVTPAFTGRGRRLHTPIHRPGKRSGWGRRPSGVAALETLGAWRGGTVTSTVGIVTAWCCLTVLFGSAVGGLLASPSTAG